MCVFPNRLRIVAVAVLLVLSPGAAAQDSASPADETAPAAEDTRPEVRPVRTDSPRDTLATFIRLRGELEEVLIEYSKSQSSAEADHIALLGKQFRALINLEEVPSASRHEVGNDTITYLLDIFGRVALPNLDDVPGEDAFDEKNLAQYRIPDTPIRITRVEEGPRQGEFLFGRRTVQVAPRFYLAIAALPLRSELDIESWRQLSPELVGPWIPLAFVRAMPASLRVLVLDTPIWKTVATALLAVIGALLMVCLNRWLRRRSWTTRVGVLFWGLLRPITVIILVAVALHIIDKQINTTGRLSTVVDSLAILLTYFSAAWLFFLASRLTFEWLILSPRIPEESLDANLLRLVAGCIGVIGAIGILAYGGQELGIPILSVLAGLGIGGLAVALAIRPTLENLIGGVILYMDRPVRVGDFCSFGDKTGTVETIGIRSTQLRGLDRTLISVPNAQFADMEIVNWAKCDEMLINETIGLRYETTADQLRYFLARTREMLHAHPRIDSDTVRVRFSGYGASALNVAIRIYAKTREWNDFHAIREDIFLRIFDLVNEAGSGFAFPSHTLYMSKDEGLDEEQAKRAADRVKAWRRGGQLPFPRFAPEQLERVDGTLDYPPRGSPEAGHEDLESAVGAERLSAVPMAGGEPERAADGQDESRKGSPETR